MSTTDQIWSYCLSDRKWMFVYVNIVNASFAIVSCILVFSLIVKYIKAKLTEDANVASCRVCRCIQCNLFWIGLLLFISCFVMLSSMAITYVVLCNDKYLTLYQTTRNVVNQSYVTSYLILVALLFGRLTIIFQDTAFEVSTRNTMLFWMLYVLTIATSVGAAYLHANSNFEELTGLMLVAGGILLVMLIVVLAYSFVHRLFAVYTSGAAAAGNIASSNRLKRLITRSSMLSIFSLALSLLSFAIIVTHIFVADVHFYFLNGWITCIDGVSTAVCTVLTYRCFTADYATLCAKCDRQWSLCWMKLSDPDGEFLPQISQHIELDVQSPAVTETTTTSD